MKTPKLTKTQLKKMRNNISLIANNKDPANAKAAKAAKRVLEKYPE
jgi:ABC-type tungstate transport system permease subunit